MYIDGFSGFSVDDTERARQFYADVVGLDVTTGAMAGLINLHLPGGGEVLVYPKGEAHTPATFTVLNLVVPDIDATVAELSSRGVAFLHYDGEIRTDDSGVHRGTPTLAWFADPAGNVVSIIERDGEGT
ncbi:hypothetical protein GCM10023169_33310 [Georgenia halophila]|uniref:VOC domain-containing protein n=1 Tax=Georgenia halophila TaxID=620889 RepID=A0ABP8LJN1_9MICO